MIRELNKAKGYYYWIAVRIGGVDWHIAFCDQEIVESMEDFEGRCLIEECIILINARLSPGRIHDVLIHEMLHAMIKMYGLDKVGQKMTGLSGAAWDEFEETFISSFGHAIFAMLNDVGFLKLPKLPRGK